MPTGCGGFQVNGKPVDSTQACNSLVGGGLANFSLVNLPTGAYTLTAHYQGDQNYSAENIVLPTFQVIAPSIEITANPAAVSTKAGTPVQTTLNLMPLVGFSGFPSLECVSATLPQYAECTLVYPNSGQGTVAKGSPIPRSAALHPRGHHQHECAGQQRYGIACAAGASGLGRALWSGPAGADRLLEQNSTVTSPWFAWRSCSPAHSWR